ncbi:choice-of-anchor E domain-containing protein [Scytonema sp. UIC 10036]|nr:choice-of-anchor E domain-containing protein [Scytonema sp. UIC 10036]
MNTKLLGILTAATTLTVLGVVSSSGVASAATLEHKAEYKPTEMDKEYVPYEGYGLTDIIQSPLTIQKFNSQLGTLKSVKIDFTGDIKGDAQFESRNATPRTVTVDLSGLVKLNMPDGASLFELNPQQQYSYNVSRFDRVTDFNGSSGKTLEGLVTSVSDTKTFTNSDLLQSFTGLGNLDFLFTALATSSVTGPGNIVSSVSTYAKSTIKVTYDYEERRKKVPEPSALLGIGLVAGACLRLKKSRSINSLNEKTC